MSKELSKKTIDQGEKLMSIIRQLSDFELDIFYYDHKLLLAGTPQKLHEQLIMEELTKSRNLLMQYDSALRWGIMYCMGAFSRRANSIKNKQAGKENPYSPQNEEDYTNFNEDRIFYMAFFRPDIWQDGDRVGHSPYMDFNYSIITSDIIDSHYFGIENEDLNKLLELPDFKDIINIFINIKIHEVWFIDYEELNSEFKQISYILKPQNLDCKLNDAQLEFLYLRLSDNNFLINPEQTDLASFKEVLTKDFNKHDSLIHFSGETTQVAYLLQSLKPFFKSLYSRIEISEKFYTHNGNLLKSSNISGQLSKMRDIEVKNQSILDNIVKKTKEIQ